MNAKSLEIAKGLIAIILLLIYLFTLGYMILKVFSWDSNGELVFNSNVIWAANVVGGLIAAVIIANLAISNPGETPISHVMELSREYGQKMFEVVTWIYIGAWLLFGLGAFITGVILRPEVNVTLNEIGKSWLGILLGSAYAWFGINRSE